MAAVAIERYHEVTDPLDYDVLGLVVDSVGQFAHQAPQDSLERNLGAIDLASNLRPALGPEDNTDWQRVPSLLQAKTRLDAMAWAAWREIRLYHGPTIEAAGGLSIDKTAWEMEFESREGLLDDIQQYDRLFKDEALAYEDLVASFHDARIAAINPSPLLAASTSPDRISLGQILPVHRMLKGLHSIGFSKARRATVEEKSAKQSVIVPGRVANNDILLRIQPAVRAVRQVVVTKVSANQLLVDMQLDTGEQSPFTMPHDDLEVLGQGVNEIRALRLKLIPALTNRSK